VLHHRKFNGVHAAHLASADAQVVAPSFANTIAFDFTCFETFHANFIVASSSAVGARCVTTFSSAPFSSQDPVVELACRRGSALAEALAQVQDRREAVRGGASFFLVEKISFARSSNPGAAIHSTKSFATSSAVAASTMRLKASTPPNAEIGSHAYAFK